MQAAQQPCKLRVLGQNPHLIAALRAAEESAFIEGRGFDQRGIGLPADMEAEFAAPGPEQCDPFDIEAPADLDRDVDEFGRLGLADDGKEFREPVRFGCGAPLIAAIDKEHPLNEAKAAEQARQKIDVLSDPVLPDALALVGKDAHTNLHHNVRNLSQSWI